MAESNPDASRPARRRPRRQSAKAQKDATDTLYKGLDRFGLAPVLLLAIAYFGHTQVIQPIASAYAKMVDEVGSTNRLLKESIDKNNQEDAERVAAIREAQELNRRLAEENRALNTKIIEAINSAATDRRSIHDETQAVIERVLRVLESRGEAK